MRMNTAPRKTKFFTKGLTLLEIVLSVGVFVVVISSVAFIFSRSLFVFRTSQNKTIAAQVAQVAVEWMLRDIQAARAIYYLGDDGIGLIADDNSIVGYYLDANHTIQRSLDCVSVLYPLAEGVNNLFFHAYNVDNTQIGVESASDIRTVAIDIATQRGEQEFQINTVARHKAREFSLSSNLWAKAYGDDGNDRLFSIALSPDGGFVAAGTTTSFGAGQKAVLVKFNSAGTVEWARTYYPSSDWTPMNVSCVLQTSDGYVLGGSVALDTFGQQVPCIFLIKTDEQGLVDSSNPLTWIKTYSDIDFQASTNVQLVSIQETPGVGFIMVAESGPSYFVGFDIIKTNLSGGLVSWNKKYTLIGGGFYCHIAFVYTSPSEPGILFLGGNINDAAFLAKLNTATGIISVLKTYNGSGSYERFMSMEQVEGGYIVGGFTDSYGAGNLDFLLLRTDSALETIWLKAYGGSNRDYFCSLKVVQGGYILAGDTESFNSQATDFFLLKVNDPLGPGENNIAWAKVYGGADDEETSTQYFGSSCLQLISDEYLIRGGYTTTFSSGTDENFFLVKTDLDGDLKCCVFAQDVSPTFTSGFILFSTSTGFSFPSGATISMTDRTSASSPPTDVTSLIDSFTVCPEE